MAKPQLVIAGNEKTWTVVDDQWSVVAPVEQYLEFARNSDYSPNTVRSYAKALALWWTHLSLHGIDWEDVKISDFGSFMRAVRTSSVGIPTIGQPANSDVSDATVASRVRPVMSFYRFHAQMGSAAAPFLYESTGRSSIRHVSFLAHIARRNGGAKRSPIRLRVRHPDAPVLPPDINDELLAAEASYDPVEGAWSGDLRYRFLWSLLYESGLRIGEVLSLRHRDWLTGRGDTARIDVVPRPHPHGYQLKSGARQIYVGGNLDAMYGDYVWWLCERGADGVLDDWDESYIFCNVAREPLFAPLRVESVYAHLRSMKTRVPDLPQAITPHWFRHTHATALLLAGVPLHVVSRRLGHKNVQTTIDRYGHVTEDAELVALANWEAVTKGWKNAE